MSNEVILQVLKVKQPIGEFFVGAIDARQLNEIAKVEIRRFNQGTQDSLAGIQREKSSSRIKRISEYVDFDYATFPTSVVIAVSERNTVVEPITNCTGLFSLKIVDAPATDSEPEISIQDSAFIIDGQHRLAGLENLEENRTFEINVSIFIGADEADKAEIFSRVNLSQTKVNKSLVYDLFHFANTPSPFKMAHDITIALNRDKEGPFFKKIKRLGTATPGLGKKETLTQATVVSGMLRYFPKNPEMERNKGFLGLSRRHEEGEDWNRYIFAPFYREDDDVSIFKIMTNYFSAVQNKWPTAWNDVETGFILNRTNGYNALMRFLNDAYLRFANTPRVVEESEFKEIFDNIDIKASELVADEFKPGSSGASALYNRLLTGSGL